VVRKLLVIKLSKFYIADNTNLTTFYEDKMEKNELEILEDEACKVTVTKSKSVIDDFFVVTYKDKIMNKSVVYTRGNLDEATTLARELFDKKELLY